MLDEIANQMAKRLRNRPDFGSLSDKPGHASISESQDGYREMS